MGSQRITFYVQICCFVLPKRCWHWIECPNQFVTVDSARRWNICKTPGERLTLLTLNICTKQYRRWSQPAAKNDDSKNKVWSLLTNITSCMSTSSSQLSIDTISKPAAIPALPHELRQRISIKMLQYRNGLRYGRLRALRKPICVGGRGIRVKPVGKVANEGG